MLTNESIILLGVFTIVLLLAYLVANFFLSRREVQQNVSRLRSRRQDIDKNIDRLLGEENSRIRYYLDVTQNETKDSLKMRLIQAGYFSPRAVATFNIIRLGATFFAVIAAQFVLSLTARAMETNLTFILALVFGGFVFMMCAIILERMGQRRQREFRKLFPDFMDLLLVCVEAGLGVNAAIDRVTREFLMTTPDFGVQLSIINLEVRAGRPLNQALMNFSTRIGVEEARILAVLLKQSEELGASIAKTLRVYAKEMRQTRILKAEEKANALPVKMLLPMAGFMFPVNLVIVLVPIMITIMKMLTQLTPGQ